MSMVMMPLGQSLPPALAGAPSAEPAAPPSNPPSDPPAADANPALERVEQKALAASDSAAASLVRLDTRGIEIEMLPSYMQVRGGEVGSGLGVWEWVRAWVWAEASGSGSGSGSG